MTMTKVHISLFGEIVLDNIKYKLLMVPYTLEDPLGE